MRRAPRKDANHAEIVAALRKDGVVVIDLSALGDDIPDLLCGRSVWKLLEIKDGEKIPSKRRLSRGQAEFHAMCGEHGLPCFVVETVEEALSLFR